MDILIISLSSAEGRQNFQREQLTHYQLEYQFLNATSTEDISPADYQQHYHDWQRPLKKTEVACYYSHRSAWEKVISTNKPMLILEDDVLLSSCITSLLPALENRPNTDLINLENRGRKKFVSKTSKSTVCSSNILRLYQDRTGAAAYILWPSGAKKLLECEQKSGIALADAHITACHLLRAYQIEPAAAIQLDHCGHYLMKNPSNQALAKSSVSTQYNHKGGWRFWLKRIYHQVSLGWRQLLLLKTSERRYIKIRSKDFYKQT